MYRYGVSAVVALACMVVLFVAACGDAATPSGGGTGSGAEPTQAPTEGTNVGPGSAPTAPASEPTPWKDSGPVSAPTASAVEPTPWKNGGPVIAPTRATDGSPPPDSPVSTSVVGKATPMPGETEAIAAAKRLLANRIETSANGIELVALAQREWSDASLGCPETGKAYAQIITPGFLIRLRSGGVVYSVHMDAAGKGVVCIKTDAQPEPAGTMPPDAGGDEDPGPEATMPPDGGGDMGDTEEQAAVAVARRAAAQEANVDMNQTNVASVEPRDWNDSSLGCPQPGMSYLQVITPGYLVIVGAGGRTYEVHTDAGKRAVVCHTDATPTMPRDELVSLVRSGGLT
ncbi:MAG: hypothetical protein WKH64_13890, partial [Chloroflexia bacterium]